MTPFETDLLALFDNAADDDGVIWEDEVSGLLAMITVLHNEHPGGEPNE